jgi:sugar lactone lactonase YvrE
MRSIRARGCKSAVSRPADDVHMDHRPRSRPTRRSTAHRTTAAAIVGSLTLIAAACGSSDGDSAESSAPPATQVAVAETPADTSSPATEAAPETAVLETTTTVAAPVCPEPQSNSVAQASGVVADLPDDESGYIEGVTVDGSGNVFVSLIRSGTVLKFAPGSTEPEVFGQIPDYADDGIGFLGLAIDDVGNVYGAVASDTSAGIWKFDCATGAATRFVGTEEMIFADGVEVDDDGIIWATDADSGADGDVGLGSIWRIDPDGAAEKWVESSILGASDADSELPGANGLIVVDDAIFTVNTALGKVVKIVILPDGSAGDVTVLPADVFASDGIAIDGDGLLYVTGVGTNVITRIGLDGSVERIEVGPDVVLACPTSAAFGTGATENILYVANLLSVGCGGAGPDLTAIDVTTAPWAPVEQAEGDAVFVVGDAAAPDPLDIFLADVAGGTGVEVTFLDDEDTGSAESRAVLDGAAMVIISGSVDPSAISPGLASVTAPLVTFSGPTASTLGLASESGETPSGETFVVMNPETADHPLAGELTGNAEVYSTPVEFLNFGIVGGDAIVIATTPGNPSLPSQYAYEAGTELADGSVAPARRVGGFSTLDSLTAVSGGAATLFFATLNWLLGER